MKKFVLIVCLALLGGVTYAHAQKVVRNGNNFTQVTSKAQKQTEVVKTQYTYTANDGITYPIYLSSTGKEYRQYLPEVTKQLQQK